MPAAGEKTVDERIAEIERYMAEQKPVSPVPPPLPSGTVIHLPFGAGVIVLPGVAKHVATAALGIITLVALAILVRRHLEKRG